MDHCSPSPLCFRYFLSKDFPDAPKTSDKNKTCWCTRTLLSRRRSSVKCPLRFNSIIIHLYLFIGCSSGILKLTLLSRTYRLFPKDFWTIHPWSRAHISCRTPEEAGSKSPFLESGVLGTIESWYQRLFYIHSALIVCSVVPLSFQLPNVGNQHHRIPYQLLIALGAKRIIPPSGIICQYCLWRQYSNWTKLAVFPHKPYLILGQNVFPVENRQIFSLAFRFLLYPPSLVPNPAFLLSPTYSPLTGMCEPSMFF